MGKKDRAKAKKKAKRAAAAAAAATKATNAANAMGADPDQVKKLYNEMRASLARAQKNDPEPMDILRMKYSMLGKKDWWYIMDEAVAQCAQELTENNYVVLDGFLGHERAMKLHAEVVSVRDSGDLRLGVLAGGRSGKDLSYQHKKVRGDLVEWFGGSEKFFNMLPIYLRHIDTLVSELGKLVPSLRGVSKRSKAMLTCYPGHGARYVKHTDNHCRLGKGDNCNGRRLTTLIYLNPNWGKKDGGELRLYGGDLGEKQVRDVEPVMDRVVMFWFDFRVPHEVLPTKADQYACTVWYFDKEECDRALQNGVTDSEYTNDSATTGISSGGNGSDSDSGSAASNKKKEHRERIQKEIQKFEKQFGGKATVIEEGSDEEEENDGSQEENGGSQEEKCGNQEGVNFRTTAKSTSRVKDDVSDEREKNITAQTKENLTCRK
jgi:hypoxia-inducible factor (prolyl hydroxylase)